MLLEPKFTTWYARFARNRLVVAYSPRSRFADQLRTGTWWRVLTSPGVEVGRSDPDRDPSGYRALIAMQLAEWHYGEPGLAVRLERAAAGRNIRPKEADLVALLETGELDAHGPYEGVEATLRAEEMRREFDDDGLRDVVIRLSRLHRPR